MKKIFTLICGMLLMSMFAAQAQTVPAFPKSLDVSLSDESKDVTLDIEDYDGVFLINVSGKSVKSSITVTVEVPEGWDGFVSMSDEDFNPWGTEPLSTRAEEDNEVELIPIEYVLEEGWQKRNALTFTVDGELHSGQFMLYTGDMVCVDHQINVEFEVNFDEAAAAALFEANQKACDAVVAEIEALQKKYEVALKEAKDKYPSYNFEEWEYMIGQNLEEAKAAAKIALENANEDAEVYTFAFDSEYYEGMIAEMGKAPITEANYQAYDKAMLQINDLRAEYLSRLYDLKDRYPSFEFNEYEYQIIDFLEYARKVADDELDKANTLGENFNFEITYFIDRLEKIMMVLNDSLMEANQVAYDKVRKQLDVLEKEYITSLKELQAKYPSYDFSEWEEIIGKSLDEAMTGSKQALEAANEDNVEFNFAFDGETIEAMIAEMNAKVPLTVDNQAAYDKVIAQLDAAQAKYEAELEALKAECPYYDFSEWNEIIGGMLDQTRTGAKQALDAANEDGEEFFYPFDDEEFEAMLAEMKKDAENAPAFPEKLDVTLSDEEGVKVSQGVEQGVYTISVSGQSEQKELTVTVAVPEGWDGFIGMSDVDANDQAAPAKVAPVEWVSVEEMEAYGMKKGNTMTFPVDGAEHSGQYYLYKGNVLDLANQIAIEFNVESPLTAANKAAYDEVIAKIDGLQKEYDEALAALTEKYPDYDFSEWKEIIGNALEEAKTGANQALKAANEDGVEFNFAFDGEDIKGMIAEMDASAALAGANQAAYDAVIAKIDELQKEYEEALAAVTAKYPDTDFSEWEEIITKALDEAKSGAAQALASANEDGVEFNFAFDGEDIKGMIAEMYASAALTEANQAAYDAVIAKIDELQKEYDEAVAEIKENNPDFDFTEWDEMIAKALEETTTGAEQALKAANEDGEEFNFAFDGEDIENIIEEMKKSATGSGVSGVAIDENASYYDLNGHKINRPQAGMYIKVVDGKSSKVVIK